MSKRNMSNFHVDEDNKDESSSSSSTSPACLPAVTQVNSKMKILRHYMMLPWTVRGCMMIIAVTFLSFLGTEEIKHVGSLTAKGSILNQVFVKMGWAWTLSALLALRLSLLPLEANKLQTTWKTGVRVVATTLVFYFFCQWLFPLIEHLTGYCVSKGVLVTPALGKKKCLKKGLTFDSFDVSGHSYLMSYCTLTLMQEARAMQLYFHLGTRFQEQTTSTEVSSEEVEPVSKEEALKLKDVYSYLWPLVILCYLAVCVLCMTWDVVLVITTVYYHTFVEKVIGVLLGVGSFALLYGYIFQKTNVI